MKVNCFATPTQRRVGSLNCAMWSDVRNCSLFVDNIPALVCVDLVFDLNTAQVSNCDMIAC